jgi:cyclomaltodextrinase / maltogenic alpha-amylase / neopullulanase
MIPLRRQHPALQNGQLLWVHNSNEQHVVTYIRRSPSEEFLVAGNLSNTPFHGTVEVEGRAWKEIPLPSSQPRETAIPALTLDAFEFRVFQAHRP